MKGGSGTGYRLRFWRQDVRHENQGFTIVEVLIVLVVTGALFVSAAIAISGRTNQTEFQQSVNGIVSQIRQIINETASGYYPNTGNFSCKNNNNSLQIVPGASAQGTNTGCIFLGKVVQFGVSATTPQQFAVFPIAGLQLDKNGNEVQLLSDANPSAIYPSVAQPGAPDDSVTNPLLYGLKVPVATIGEVGMYYDGNKANTIGAFAIIPTLGSYAGTPQLQSGSQQYDIYPIIGSSLGSTVGSTVGSTNTYLNGIAPRPQIASKGIQICFDSASSNQSGLVTVGGAGQQLAVTLSIVNQKGC